MSKSSDKSAWVSRGIPRHELPRVRAVDLQLLLNISRTSVWRVTRLVGFPKPDRLGRFDRKKVLAFVTRAGDRIHPQAQPKGSTESASIERKGVAKAKRRATPIRTAPAP